ncbi:protein-tyrosine-phosphatase [Natronogracilivirga saccharolytica]|uniref:Protein-tyrosine-phosphatase n=1 Tax=Natronogracilivirga saccharolytica TaxID=2812953 RepID=A0A8J7RR64_9BACT|nr:protein-tyrosine-phosphatase [Natronogracilivirga saccharolytica]MBP3191457.1 protein-tyrosine-phosphatase [Natronogracilivirga saccharolytica]
MSRIYPVIDQLIDQFLEEEDHIPQSRQHIIEDLVKNIRDVQKSKEPVRLNFICTHNSRRSQMAQIWAHALAHSFQIPSVECYSGGTEVTAFHPNAIRAMKTLGFQITPETPSSNGPNPRWHVSAGSNLTELVCYSKKIEDSIDQSLPFIAVMTCSDADQNCPVVPGAQSRAAFTFEDPKSTDGTDKEQQAYLKTAVGIGRELTSVFKSL